MTTTLSASPLIIGHRGSSAVAPENTMAAFRRAVSDAADGIEFDVRLARDGVPIVIHDATLRRTAKIPGAVTDFTGSELQEIDVGSWFNRQCPALARSEYEQETIPSLRQLFQAMAKTDAILYLEMKSDASQAHDLAAAVMELIREFGLTTRVVVESFDLLALAILKSLDPAIRLAPLFERTLKRPLQVLNRSRMFDLALQLGANEIALSKNLIRPAIVARANSCDLPIVAWTIDDPQWLRRARSLGIKGLITNDPQRMLQARARLPIQ